MLSGQAADRELACPEVLATYDEGEWDRMSDGYELLAPYYDQIHAEMQGDIGFVLTFASRQPGPLLELGCGSGRLLLPLARAGYTVTGLDSSPAMLHLARSHLDAEAESVRARVSLIHGDMTDFSLGASFGGVLLSHNTAMHLNMAALSRCLQHLRRHLHPDGQLLIDLANPHVVAATPTDKGVTLERVLKQDDEQIMQFASSWLEPDAQKLLVTWWFDRLEKDSGIVRRSITEMVYHYYYLHQLTGLLMENEFTIVDILGGYNEAVFAEESERLLLIAGC